MKRITLFLVMSLLLLSSCASVQMLEKKKSNLETLMNETEKATNAKIALIESEMNGLISKIDKSDSLNGDEKDNEKIAALQEKVNEEAIKGRDKVDRIANRIRALEEKITVRMDTRKLD